MGLSLLYDLLAGFIKDGNLVSMRRIALDFVGPVKVINLVFDFQPFAGFWVNGTVGYQDMSMGISVLLVVMDGPYSGVAMLGIVFMDEIHEALLLLFWGQLPGEAWFAFFRCPGVLGLLIFLNGIEQTDRIAVGRIAAFRQLRSIFRHPFLSAVLVGFAVDFVFYLLARDIGQRLQ